MKKKFKQYKTVKWLSTKLQNMKDNYKFWVEEDNSRLERVSKHWTGWVSKN